MSANEVQLLVECLQTQGEAESDGIKFLFMDDSTIYRFENNRMKKVSQALLKKARKLMESQNAIPGVSSPSQDKPKRGRKKVKVDEEVNEGLRHDKNCVRDSESLLDFSSDERRRDININEEDDVEDEEPIIKAPPKKKSRGKAQPISNANNEVDLNEYYNTKNRLEFMNKELERLNGKVSKLKHYKSIVNKLTGGEFDIDIPDYRQPQQGHQQLPQGYQQLPQQPKVNDSLFMF